MDLTFHFCKFLLQAGIADLKRLKNKEKLEFECEAGEIGPDEYTVTISRKKKEKSKAIVPTGVAMMRGMTPGATSKIKEVKPIVKEHVRSDKDTRDNKNDKDS